MRMIKDILELNGKMIGISQPEIDQAVLEGRYVGFFGVMDYCKQVVEGWREKNLRSN